MVEAFNKEYIAKIPFIAEFVKEGVGGSSSSELRVYGVTQIGDNCEGIDCHVKAFRHGVPPFPLLPKDG